MNSSKFFVIFILFPVFGKTQFVDSVKSQLIKDWTRSKSYTIEYLNTMPDDKYEFHPLDSIRNFAQQMIHLSQATISLMNAATGREIPAIINRTNLEQTPSAWSKDSVLYFVTLSYDYAIAAMTEFDLIKAFERVSRGTLNESRFGWSLKAYEHQAHHRGQAAIYIRLVCKTPPFEKLFN